jgi:hypothetical protein
MTWHPTTNRVQCELLTPEEEKALKVWTHGHEIYDTAYEEWINCPEPIWSNTSIYRGKPAPVVTSLWYNQYDTCMAGPYDTRGEADDVAGPSLINVLRIDTYNGVSTAHLEGLKDD